MERKQIYYPFANISYGKLHKVLTDFGGWIRSSFWSTNMISILGIICFTSMCFFTYEIIVESNASFHVLLQKRQYCGIICSLIMCFFRLWACGSRLWSCAYPAGEESGQMLWQDHLPNKNLRLTTFQPPNRGQDPLFLFQIKPYSFRKWSKWSYFESFWSLAFEELKLTKKVANVVTSLQYTCLQHLENYLL